MRFGTPRVLISENNNQFECNPSKNCCDEKKIHRQFTSVAHPQANNQNKVSNKTIFNSLKKRLMKSKTVWVK